jgi:serine/threonine-protein kinase
VSAPVLVAPPFEPASLVGTVLDGRYELVGHLASGGMGAVFQARHVHLRKDVAVKVLRPELSASGDLVERFRREAEITSALDHENLVHVTDFGRSESGLLFLVMDLLVGESLFDRLRRERVLRPSQAVAVLGQVCAGLEAAHAHGVVHRDLKPENVFLARGAGGREVVKLLDFGIAKFARSTDGGTQDGMVVGTPEYLSPEQAMGLAVDARADLYTVGLLAFRMLTGRQPFRADDARGLLLQQASMPVPRLEDASPELAAWPRLSAAVARACEKDPAARPATAGELGTLLAEALDPAFVAPPGVTPSLSSLSRPALTAAPRVTEAFGSVGSPRQASPAPAPGPRPRLRLALVLCAAAVALAAAGVGGSRHLRERPVATTRALLAAGRLAEARDAAEAGLRERPHDPVLLLLRARALRGLGGDPAAALDAYAEAQAAAPLGPEALREVAQDLGRERGLADRAARVLRDGGDGAVPAVVAAARAGPAVQRLRALVVLRDLGAEDSVERVAIYAALLSDADCDVRRAAARRLGELGDADAVPALKTASAVRTERRGLLGIVVSRPPGCGALEAADALKRIQSAR